MKDDCVVRGVMRRRSERTLKELYDCTERILEAEGFVPTEEKFMLAHDFIGMKSAAEARNICSAPCSSCMNDFRSSSAVGSTNESGCSGNICYRGKADICFSGVVNGTALDNRRTFDDSQNVSSETSNLLRMRSSYNSYSENVESKSALIASAAHDLEEDLDKPQMDFSGEIIKKEQPLGEKTFHGQFCADSHISIPMGCRDPSVQGEDQARLECHGDNISCITGGMNAIISDYGDNLYLEKKDRTCGVGLTNSLILNENETSVLSEAGDSLQVHETVKGDFSLRRSNATADSSILNDTSNSASVSATPDNYGFPLLKVDVYQISGSPISHSKIVCSSFDKADCSDTEENLNVKLQAGCMKYEKMDNVESSLGSFSAVSSAWGKHDALENHEVSRNCFSSEKLKVDDLCQEFRTETNSQISSDNVSRIGDLSEPLEKDNILLGLETINRQIYYLPPLSNTEIENSESESALYDVKVCDICGDVGREAQLANCSRCSDGAEHTYCMREKLDKLPGADWLCEECQTKEMGNHGVDKSNTICGGSKPIFLNKISQNSISTLIPKKLPKLDAGVICLNDEVLATPNISTRRQADHVEERKVSETSTTPIKTECSKKTPVLSYAISFKSQKRKVRKENMELSEGHSVNALHAVHHSENYLSPGSLCQPRTHSSYRHFSRSVSFNNSIINQKVKLVKNVLCKQRIKREVISSQLRNGTWVKPINKSASFKSSSSGFSNIDPVRKDQSSHPSRIENPRGLDALKKRIIVEKKNPSAIYKASISKLAASASNCHPKINRSSQNEGNVKSTIDSSCQSVNKRSYDTSDLGRNDSKRRILHSSSSMKFFDEKFSSENGKQCKKVTRTGFSAVNGSCVKVDTASRHGLVQLSESDPKDNKISTGHANQQCATYKLEGSTHLPSDELNLSRTMKKGKVPEDVLDAMVPKTRTLSKGKNLNKFDKLPEANGGVICLADSINTSSSFSQRNIALVVDSSKDNDSLKFSVELGKAVAATDSVNRAVRSTDSLVVPKENRSNHIPTFNELNVKSLSETSPREESILASQLRASAIPKLGFIWQGSFSVLRSDSCPQSFNGIQAHLSTCASQRVFEVASVVPSKLQLEEVSQTSLWPLQCQGIYPTEKNIALFFFAKDNESYENSYRSLLDKMLKNDLAFRGKVNEAELLIFTSKMLPAYSKRWNMLYYLWGMFISKRKHCLSTQKNCKSNLSIEFLGQGISELPLRNGPNAQTLDSTLTSMIFSEYETSPKVNQGESNMCVDLHCMSSEGEPKSCRAKNTSYSVNLSSQVATDAKIIQEIPLSLTDNSSSTTAKPFDVISNPELQLRRSQLSYKVNIGMGCQNNFHDDGTNGKLGKSPLAFDINIEAGLDRASPVPSISSINYPVEECSKNECKKKTRHCSPNDLAILGYNPSGNTSEVNWGGRKHEHSCSTQTVLQTSGKRASWMQVNDESEQKMTYYSTESSFGEENLSSSIFCQQQRTQNICSESVMPEVERSFFTVDIGPSSYNKYDKLAHIAASNDDDDDDDPESYTPDLELTLGSRSNRKTKPAPLLPLLYPSLDRGSQHRRSGPPGNDGDDLSALLSL